MTTMRLLRLTAVVSCAIPVSLLAQIRPMGSMATANRAPDKDASQVMITSFRSNEKAGAGKAPENGLSYQAAEEMRRKVDGAFSYKQIYVIPVERINPNLTASAFSTTDALEPHDAKQLAVQIRADEYIAGTANKVGDGYKVTADLVLTRDINARQPLGAGEAHKLGDAIELLVKEYKEARKQLEGEKKCVRAVTDAKYAEAVQFADAGIAAYPKSTLARACKLNALYLSKASPDEIVKVAKEISAIDPRSNTAMKFVADAYRKGGAEKSDSLVLALLRMMQNDPKNSQLQFDAINEIASAKNPAIARPIIDSTVLQNPGDPDLLKLRWKILGAVKDYKAMREQGLELIRLDTAFADTTYFSTTANAYAQDSMWQQAASAAAEGVKKFPTDAYLVGFEIQMLQKAGQTQQALDKLDKASAAKIPVPDAGTMKLFMLQELKSPLVLATAREMVAAGDTTANVRQIILNEIQMQMTAAQKMVATDAAAATDSLNSVLTQLKEGETLAKTSQQKGQVAFLAGYSNLTLAGIKAQQGQATKSCQLLRDARANTTAAMTNLPTGSTFAPAATVQQAMGQAMQLDTGIGQLMGSLPNCK